MAQKLNNGTIKISKLFQRTLEMPLVNCEINIGLSWSEKSVIMASAVAD